MKARHKFLVVSMALLSTVPLSLSCSDPGEYAIFEADDVSALPECIAEQFPFEPNLLAARVRNERVGIFLQTSPDIKSRYDLAYFELYDPDSITVGEAIELGGPEYPPPQARGKMVFFSSCAFEHDSLILSGSLVFESFDTEVHGVISGRLEDGQAIDARTDQIVIENLSGEWHFAVRRGPPYEDFYALPERP